MVEEVYVKSPTQTLLNAIKLRKNRSANNIE
jgi:hypothetical protein